MSNPDMKKRIKLTSYDALFDIGGEDDKKKTAPESSDGNQIIQVSVHDLHSFKNHPFSILEDEAMDDLIASVKEYGVIQPCVVRTRPEGGYELVSGHRRRHAAIKAGLRSIPAVIRNLDDDEAVIMMVDANLQRECIFISEKAKAYKMKYDALKHQGIRREAAQHGINSTLHDMAEASGESKTQIQRFIKLASLIEEMLILLDDGKLQIRSGVQLAELDVDAQILVFEFLKKDRINISELQAMEIKNMFQTGTLTRETLKELLLAEKEPRRKVSFGAKRLD